MSKTRTAIHQADLLRNEILRLDERRRRQIARADGAFQLDLHALVSGRVPWLLDMVQGALEHAVQMPELARSLRQARGMSDPHEAPVEPPGSLVLEADDLPPPLPPRAVMGIDQGSAPGFGLVAAISREGDGNEAWGMPTRVPRFEADLPRTMPRYPEPGEPARQLDDGTVVFDDGQRQ